MPTPGANIVLRLDLTSAAPQPPIIPYLHHGAFSGCNVGEKKVVITTTIIKSAFRPWMNGKVKGSAQQWTLVIRSFQKYSAPLIFFPKCPVMSWQPGRTTPSGPNAFNKSKRCVTLQTSTTVRKKAIQYVSKKLMAVLITFREMGVSRLPLSRLLQT